MTNHKITPCKIEIPGLDGFKCARCGWVKTQMGLYALENGIALYSKKKNDCETKKELQIVLQEATVKRNQCKCST